MANSRLFRSFFMGGFECSTQRLPSGRRLDMVAVTGHDQHAVADYARLRERGLCTAREGIRWHLVEPAPGRYDFATVLPMIRAARAAGVEVIWDLWHYGWPGDLDIWRPAFVRRFAGLARAFARLLADETGGPHFIAPINEPSYFAWAGGEVADFAPFATGRGTALKAQLVRAAIAGIEAIWEVLPGARIVHPDPVVHIVSRPADDPAEIEGFRLLQFQAWDMLAGRLEPGLGGRAAYLDILGVNYYPQNQWVHWGRPLSRSDPRYRPFRDLLREVHDRYQCPLFVAETGAIGAARPGWLRYVGREVRAAMRRGVPVEGLCLYPIVDADWSGWDDNPRHRNGLWDYPDAAGGRAIDGPLATELREQARLLPPLCGG